MDMAYKMYFFFVIMVLSDLTSSQAPVQVALDIVCEDNNNVCIFLSKELCNEIETRKNCPETCGICREEVKSVWRHLHNMLELPYEDRTIGRGDKNYVYVLENENLTLNPVVEKVSIPAIPNIKTLINPEILLQKREYPPAAFDPRVQEKIKLLVAFFTDSKDSKELLKFAVNLKDHINEDIFVKALSKTLHKPKFQLLKDNNHLGSNRNGAYTNINKKVEVQMPSRHESFPTHFIKRSSSDYGIDEHECKKESDLRDGCVCERWPGWQENKGVESKIAYWTEDRDMNNFHYRWHEFNDRIGHEVSCDDPEYRHGELFGYFHQQILARYDMERLSNGISRVKALDGWINNSKYKVEEPFFGGLDKIRNRCSNQTLSQGFVDKVSSKLETIKSDIRNRHLKHNTKGYLPMEGIQGYSMLASIVERDKNCKDGPFDKNYIHLHNDGHNEISRLGCDGYDDSQPLGPMDQLDVSARDPVFWRWHKFIDETLQSYADDIQPYGTDELLLDGVEVTDVAVQDISGAVNELQTFRSYIETNYTFGKQVHCVSQPELNHDPFDYKISIKNHAQRRKVNLRIYMAPVYNEKHEEFTFDEQRSLWALMDRFSFELKKGPNMIKRGSCHSTLTTMPPLSSKDISKILAEQTESEDCETTGSSCGDGGHCSQSCKEEEDVINGYCKGRLCKCCKEKAICNGGCGQGICEASGRCRCNKGYNGPNCDKAVCIGGCEHGTCIGPDKCRCSEGYSGLNCDQAVCVGGCEHGNCIAPGKCSCSEGYSGQNCDQEYDYYEDYYGDDNDYQDEDEYASDDYNADVTQPVVRVSRSLRCEDLDSDCAKLKPYCKLKTPLLKKNCRKTCGFCVADNQLVVPASKKLRCEDIDSKCADYKSSCQYKNPNLLKKCRKTCGLCTAGNQLVVPASQILRCEDIDSNCADYKSSCEYKNPKLLKKCRKTCGLCTAGPSLVTQLSTFACEDQVNNCAILKQQCYKDYVIQICQKTCGLCTEGPSLVTTQSPTFACEDQVNSCATLKDQCYKDYVLQICQKTCGLCTEGCGKPGSSCGNGGHCSFFCKPEEGAIAGHCGGSSCICCKGKPICNGGCGHGICESPGRCRCNKGYNQPNCDKAVCVGGCEHGTCIAPDQCSCSEGYSGLNCDQAICKGGCGQGTCEAPGRCSCRQGYEGPNCDKAVCDGGCGQGTCEAPGRCSCNTGYTGLHCGYSLTTTPVPAPTTTTPVPVCEDNPRYNCDRDRSNCNKNEVWKEHMFKRCRKTCGFCDREVKSCTPKCVNGDCDSYKNKCTCLSGWKGNSCDMPRCNGGCGEGTCIEPQNCRCPHGRMGPNCEGYGSCEAPGQCQCTHGYFGKHCDNEFIAVNQRKVVEVDKVCKDENSECAHLAESNATFCDDGNHNSEYMFNADMCRKSCGICSTACKDDPILECQKYKDRGLCEKNTHVQQRCPKTCFDCKGVDGAIPCQCGLPHHLLIPKGTEKGMAFQIFVMITPYHTSEEELDYDCEEADCSVLCAINQQKCLGHKKGEPMAFPFDRKMEKVGEKRIKKIEDLDKILPNAKAQKIHIYHKEKVKNEQKCT